MKCKKGDLIIVTQSKNGVPLDCMLEVTAINSGNMTVTDSEGRGWAVYTSGNNKEVFILADRPSRLKHAIEKVEELKKELGYAEREVYILTNFDSDEAYTAHKLTEILKAKDDPKAMEKLLKELKETHYL